MTHVSTSAAEAARNLNDQDRDQMHSGSGDRVRTFAGAAARHLRPAGEREEIAATKAAETVTATMQHMIEQGQQVMRGGLHTMAAANEPLINAGHEQGRRVIEAALRIGDTYREAVQRAADDAQALVECQARLGSGLRQWQDACFELCHRTFDATVRKQQGMLQCRSLADAAEMQRDLYADVASDAFNLGTTMLRISARVAQDALRPLQDRMRPGGQA